MTEPNTNRGKPWFSPKGFGYGAGAPVSWEGWAVLVGFLAATIAAAALLDGWLRPAVIALLVVVLGVVAYRKTDGGWRWRGMR